jgi:hypothetical protein
MTRRVSTVQEIDAVTEQFQRLPDRPDGRFVRPRLDDIAKEKAKQRLRTAAWRNANDRRGRPTGEQIGKALLMAVCTSQDFKHLLDADLSIVGIAVEDMVERGFSRGEIHDVMRRIRHRQVDSADRVWEAAESTDRIEPTPPELVEQA